MEHGAHFLILYYPPQGGTVELALADLQRADLLCPHDPTIRAVYNKLPKLLRIHGDQLMAGQRFEEAAEKFSRAVAGLDANTTTSPSTANTSLKEYCQVHMHSPDPPNGLGSTPPVPAGQWCPGRRLLACQPRVP